MNRPRLLAAAALAVTLVPALGVADAGFVVARSDARAFAQPASGLVPEAMAVFERGQAMFEQRWAVFPSFLGAWGLGPTFVGDRCGACHINAGRGLPPKDADEAPLGLVIRLSVPGVEPGAPPRPHPHYGEQIQNQGLREAEVFVDWQERSITYPDGDTESLRRPVLRWEALHFGPLGDDTMVSLRVAPALAGLGLLEAVPSSTLERMAAQQRASGLDGRLNLMPGASAQTRTPGRFGWKASQPDLPRQIAAAFAEDLGVTSSLLPERNCPPVQAECQRPHPGREPELLDRELEDLVSWARMLAVPQPRHRDAQAAAHGSALFEKAGCAACHVPELQTGDMPALPSLSRRTLRAYTDLLLHDMGEGLADGRPDHSAGARDWRTPALWGLGLAVTVSGRMALLHDGRARSVSEAILWHGGAATAAREAFRNLPRAEREALVRFVDAL